MQVRNRVKELRQVRAAELIPHPKNWRRHPRRQAEALREVLNEIGYADAVLVRETDQGLQIIDGHLRAETTPDLLVPVLVLDLNDEEAEKVLLSHDPLGAMAQVDGVVLQELLGSVRAQGEAMQGLLADLAAQARKDIEIKAGRSDPDKVPPLDDAVETKVGDVWRLGQHIILCGDGSRPEEIQTLLGGKRANICFTDPPYNVRYGGPGRVMANDDLGDDFEPFLRSACEAILSHTDGAIYICMSSAELHRLRAAFTAVGGHWSTFIIWAKGQFTLGRSDYQRQYEPILYGWREGARRRWCGGRGRGDVWSIDKPVNNELHPTQKPVALVEEALLNSSLPGELVLDPFLGSGTTLVAAERLGRRCFGVEIEPRYVEVAVRRWEAFTGGRARLHKGEVRRAAS